MKPARSVRSLRAAAALPAVAVFGALTLNACLFGDPDPIPNGPDRPIEVSPCVDVPASVKAQADGLVAQGNQEMVGNFQYWFGESNSWWEAKARSPQGALDKYNGALAVAPGHCQAIFGKAIASATMITQDKRMDDFIRKVEAANGDAGDLGLAKKSSFAAVFKTSPNEAPAALAKLNASLERVDPPTVQEAQQLIEVAIMPRLDSTIAALETIMDYSMFAVRFDVDGRTFEIDRGEVGPGLAGLKVAKAWLTVVAGYNLDFTPDGSYEFARTLSTLRNDDFDHLTKEQKDALDHVTGLFKTGSAFTRQKQAWKARIQGIPQLLLGAVGDAQRGINSAIEEARNGDPQTYDILRAGSGEDADIDTVDLHGLVSVLEKTKKYLTGEVLIEYSRGSRTIRVDFTRLFHVDGVQNLFPYFKFLPYAEWNDTLSSDTSWTISGDWGVQEETMLRAGYDSDLRNGGRDWYVAIRDSIVMKDDGTWSYGAKRIILETQGMDPETGMWNTSSTTLAELETVAGQPCGRTFKRRWMAKRDPADPDAYVLTPDMTQGSFTLAGCRAGDGFVEYVEYVDAVTKPPFVFTDAQGNVTLNPIEMNAIKDPSQLKGKVIFRDPTFGGIFPGQTNETVWQQVSDLGKSPGDRVIRDCREVEMDGWIEWRCESHLPSNPSDLDYFVYYLDWLDRLN